MGTAREYGPNGLQAPRSLWRSSGIPTTAPDGYAGVVPQFTLPAGVALVAEGVDHAEFDAVSPDAVTIGRAGAWSTLTSEAMLSTSIAEVSAAHARIIARNVDKATVAKIEDATHTAVSIDEAMVTVAAEAACDVRDLWIFGAPPRSPPWWVTRCSVRRPGRTWCRMRPVMVARRCIPPRSHPRCSSAPRAANRTSANGFSTALVRR